MTIYDIKTQTIGVGADQGGKVGNCADARVILEVREFKGMEERSEAFGAKPLRNETQIFKSLYHKELNKTNTFSDLNRFFELYSFIDNYN